MSRKVLGLTGFVATGAGLLGETILQGQNMITSLGVIAIISPLVIGLSIHYKELIK